MLDRVSFAGIKSLARVDVDLAPLTVFVGPNGCGKSTILNEIERVCEASWPEESQGAALGRAQTSVDHPTRNTRTDGVAEQLLWHAHSDRGSLTIQVEPKPNPKAGFDMNVEIEQAGASRRFDFNDDASVSRAREALLGKLAWSAARLRLSPEALRLPSPGASDRPTAEGHGLPTMLVDIAANDQEAYARIQADLGNVVPAFSRLRPTKSSDNGTSYALNLQMKTGIVVPAAEVSDGTLFALALLAVLHAGTAEIILMDDLDHGLHLGAQVRLLEAIRAVQSQRSNLQVLCTTHSPVLLDSFRPEEVRVMALDAVGHTRVKPLTAHPEFERWSKALTTGEMWANLSEDWVLQDG